MNSLPTSAWGRAGLALCLCIALSAQAQTCAVPGRDGTAPSSGTVNTYYPPAQGVYTPLSTSLALGTRRGAATAVEPGDLVVVMQMQCASINTTNSTNYGAGDGTGRGYTDPVGSCLAGRYQYVLAGAATTSTSLDLSGSPLTATYVQDATTAANRRTFQVIRVPQHSALTLSGTVTAPHWNGNTGGVVVLDVAGALNWNAQTVNVAGRGFRGGAAVSWFGVEDVDNPPGYRATLDADLHATKGEGIGGTPRWVLNESTGQRQDNGSTWGGYVNGDQGRGAPANAGGGGNNRADIRDNGGGGGGGNGGIGGWGAYGWKSGGWGGVFTASDFDMRGIGGGAFLSAAPNRVVMGGGGGAGGSNSGFLPDELIASSGGAGGGIVVVRAGSMAGSGTVNAGGANGRTQLINDSAGGGGAGGSVVLMSVGGGLGAVTVNARGGRGGDSFLVPPADETHAGGGGGAGGVVLTSTGITPDANGGANGITNLSGDPVGGASHGATSGAVGSNAALSDSAFSPQPSARCLPRLTVTKRTLTPTVSTASATSVSYTIVVSNSGGAATGADLVDNALPPGWTFAQTSALAFAPALSSTVWGGFVEGAVAGQPALPASPGSAANLSTHGAPAAAPVWANLTIPGVANNIPGTVTLSFVANVPGSAPVACFHNPAGVKYLDPTRSTAGREITPATHSAANRAGALVGGTANTAYETNPGVGTAVAGSNYSGLPEGLSQEDVCLLGDLSITKSAPASTTAGHTLTYTLLPRNNGRAIRDLTFSADQATDASHASTTTRVLSSGGVRVVDTLPTGLTLTSPIAVSGWNCSLAGSTITCDSTAPLPIAANTDLAAITGTVRVSNAACAGPVVNTATVSGWQAPYADSTPGNNTGTASTALNCNANLSVRKDNGTSSVLAGSTTTYTVVFSNDGPSSADGAVLTDVPGAGLSSCSVTSCSASGGNPVAAACPATPADLLGTGGVAASPFPAGGTLSFLVRCTVGASGT